MKTRISTIVLVCATAIAVTALRPTLMLAQGRSSLQIFVPRKVNLGSMPAPFPNIGVVKANISVTSNSAITFTITDPHNVTQAFSAVTPAGTQLSMSFPSGDTVTLTPNAAPDNPNRYEIDFILRSDSAPDCAGTQSQPQNVYTVAIRPTDPKLTGVCLDSYDGRYRSVPINVCSNAALGANQIPIPLDDPADKVASLDQSNQPTTRCSSFVPSPPSGLRLAPSAIEFRRLPDRQRQ